MRTQSKAERSDATRRLPMIPTAPVFHQNAVLFGHDPSPGLLAFELVGDDQIRVFARGEDGRTTTEIRPFHPFLLLASTDLLVGWSGGCEVQPLHGDGLYRFLVLFHGWADALKARAHLQMVTGKAQTAPDAPFLFLSDPIQQYLHARAAGPISFNSPSPRSAGCSWISRHTALLVTSFRARLAPKIASLRLRFATARGGST